MSFIWYKQHDSNFPIHEGFGDFYVNLGDSRALYKETQPSKSKETSVDVNDKKHEKERDDYQKAMDEYAIVSLVKLGVNLFLYLTSNIDNIKIFSGLKT